MTNDNLIMTHWQYKAQLWMNSKMSKRFYFHRFAKHTENMHVLIRVISLIRLLANSLQINQVSEIQDS